MSSRDRVGTVVHDYRLVRRIGGGAMGDVYEARHEELDRVAAVKFLNDARLSDNLRQRFWREATALNRLRSKHIVELINFGRDPEPFLLMQFVVGETLEAILERCGCLDAPTAVRIARQTFIALDTCHAAGVVHRDVKPSNLMLARDGEGPVHVVVIDFGLATKSEGTDPLSTQSNQVLGTPYYMAPEQIRGGAEVDGRADVYSVGVMLYEMLSGQRPFQGTTAGQVLGNVLDANPTPLGVRCPSLEPPLSVLIQQRLMAGDREKRFSSAAEANAALAPFDTLEGQLEPLLQGFQSSTANERCPRAVEGEQATTQMTRSHPATVSFAPPQRAAPAPAVALGEQSLAVVVSPPAVAPDRPEAGRGNAALASSSARQGGAILRTIGLVTAALASGAGLTAWLLQRPLAVEGKASLQDELQEGVPGPTGRLLKEEPSPDPRVIDPQRMAPLQPGADSTPELGSVEPTARADAAQTDSPRKHPRTTKGTPTTPKRPVSDRGTVDKGSSAIFDSKKAEAPTKEPERGGFLLKPGDVDEATWEPRGGTQP